MNLSDIQARLVQVEARIRVAQAKREPIGSYMEEANALKATYNEIVRECERKRQTAKRAQEAGSWNKLGNIAQLRG